MLINFLMFLLKDQRGSVGGGTTLLGGEPVTEAGEPVAEEPTVSEEVDLIGEGWLKGVSKEFGEDPVMKAVPDMPTLVKNYVHAQRQMGKKGFHLPDNNSAPEQWRELYTALGGPIKDEYKYDLPDDVPLDENFMNGFNQVAYDNNILPKQAKAIVDYYLGQVQEEQVKFEQETQQEAQEALDALKQEWGQGFEKRVAQAQTVVREFGNESLSTYLEESGLGNNPHLIRLLSNIGENLNEDSFQHESVKHLGFTPDEAQEKINMVMSDSEHPYNNPMHANHKNAVKEISKLFEVVHGR